MRTIVRTYVFLRGCTSAEPFDGTEPPAWGAFDFSFELARSSLAVEREVEKCLEDDRRTGGVGVGGAGRCVLVVVADDWVEDEFARKRDWFE